MNRPRLWVLSFVIAVAASLAGPGAQAPLGGTRQPGVPASLAAGQQQAPTRRYTGTPIDIDFQGADLRMVLRQGLVIVLTSLVIGTGIALAVSRAIASLLYGVSPTDPVALAAVPLVLLSAASAATLVPARRAMRVDPMRALRSE